MKKHQRREKACRTTVLVAALVLLASCAVSTRPTPAPIANQPATQTRVEENIVREPVTARPDPVSTTPEIAPSPATTRTETGTSSAPAETAPWVRMPPEGSGSLRPSSWAELPGWQNDDLTEAWPAFVRSCMALKSQPDWQAPCWAAAQMRSHDDMSLRKFFESWFRPYRVINADGSRDGLVTGYYEPLVRGSRTRTAKYRFPIYSVPDDLLTIEVDQLFPELKGERVRGRRDNGHVVPYFTRAEIERGIASLEGKELLWVDDQVELFFLHIQGSGRVQLDNGEIVRVGYANHNGHPYRSVGRILVDRGELNLAQASMQGIKKWGTANPQKLPGLLGENPAYVFFRELPSGQGGPIGALGVPITPRRSIAVDEQSVPLGAPVYLATSWPNTSRALSRLMFAQDKGGAIKGAVRADFFWGFGDDAAQLAGRMRQAGQMWVLLPSKPITTSDSRHD